MGYDMMISGTLTIPMDKRADALAAILKAHDEDAFWSNPKFQDKRERDEEVTFEEVFDEVMARYSFGEPNLDVGPQGDWLGEDDIYFQGEVRAGWGENQVAHAIAPFVTEGVICWEGEDGEQGRYVFAYGKVEEQGGTVIYGMSHELAHKLQSQIDRDTETMLEQRDEVTING